MHLHGQLFQVRSIKEPSLIYHIDDINQNGWELKIGDLCEKGSQLRPNIVWFGEDVPLMNDAIEKTMEADIFVVVGTSLQVYPAAGLLNYVSDNVSIYVIDPNIPHIEKSDNIHLIEDIGSNGLQKLKRLILEIKN